MFYRHTFFRSNFFPFLACFLIAPNAVAAKNDAAPLWQGFYFGPTFGSVFSQYHANTTTQPGSVLSAAQVDVINNAGNQNIDTDSFLAGFDGGYNWQYHHFLLGLEADFQSLGTNGSINSGALPDPNQVDGQFVVSAYAYNNWLLSLRPRFGWATNRWLVYLTGGLGVTLLQGDFVFTSNAPEFESKRVDEVKPGYVLGAGVEATLTKHLSLSAMYLFTHFGVTHAFAMNNHISSGQPFSNTLDLRSHIVKLGLNYHFNDDAFKSIRNSTLLNWHQWHILMGLRSFISSGIDGAPQPLLNSSDQGNQLASRLIFSGLTAISQETFFKLEHSSGFFLKGYLGAGSVVDGQLNDEDFPAVNAYSNTLSDVLGNLSYATADMGYTFLNADSSEAGFFIGYDYYAENLGAYDCQQLAGDVVCASASELSKFLGISQDDTYQSLRLGLSSQFNLTHRLYLLSEAAFLPMVDFKGTDIHNARQLIGPENADQGDGAMLELILGYQLNRSWNLGLGARYWMWNMHNGNAIFDFLGYSGTLSEPARYNATRYGGFVQLSYHYHAFSPQRDDSFIPNWKGLFVGADVGGVWENSDWSDPFGETPGNAGAVNVPGFGDRIRSTGPLGGFFFNLNEQKKQFVYGVSGSFDVADVRGQNTIFSGLGGVNGEIISNSLGVFVGRVGIMSHRALYYVNGGAALVNAEYRINANSGALTLGVDNQFFTGWGWTVGLGVDYQFSQRWSSRVEYDYIKISEPRVVFSSLTTINTEKIAIKRNLNIFKMGVSYHFKWFE